MKIIKIVIISAFLLQSSVAQYILVPMDLSQTNHIKAYGIAYWVLTYEVEIDWLLNYRGGSFMFKQHDDFEKECKIRGVSYEIIANVQSTAILTQINDPEVNMDAQSNGSRGGVMGLIPIPRTIKFAVTANF